MATYVYKCPGCKKEICRDLEKPTAARRSYCSTAGKNVQMVYLRPHGDYSVKRIHYADKIREDGAVSALCFATPRAIDLRKATWSNRKVAVTCSKCLQKLSERRE